MTARKLSPNDFLADNGVPAPASRRGGADHPGGRGGRAVLMGEMRCLSIQPPWIGAIAYSDKRVENRSWPAPGWIIGQRIALHASKGPDWDAPGMAWTASGLTPYEPGAPRKAWTASLTLGAVMAVATVAGCHPRYHICNPCGPVTVVSIWGKVTGSEAEVRGE